MARKKSLLLFSTIALGLSFFITSQTSAASPNKRLWGNDRYGTCSAIVQDGWRSSSDYAVIVNGENFPDALSASTLAKKYNAPILLTQSDTLNDNTYGQLKRLKVKQVFIVGGDFVVHPSVEQAIKSLGIQVTRYKGQDRNETSVKVAEQIGTENGVILTTDSDFTDALSIAPIAGNLQMPIILIPKDTVPASVKNFISTRSISKTYVLGGTDIISDSVASQFPNTQRIVGNDKYERNINIMSAFSDKLNFNNIYITYSEGFADALSGSAIAALEDNPIVLLGDNPSYKTSNFIKNKLTLVNQINILGGTAGIKDNQLDDLLNGTTNEISGYWSGSYYASQGKTSLVLRINDISNDGTISSATFDFGPLEGNPSVPVGSYEMTGKLNKSDNTIDLTGVKWINKPSNYEMVNIHGKLDLNDRTIKGYVTNQTDSQKYEGLNINYVDSSNLINANKTIGDWYGYYYASQGKTSINLDINKISDDGTISDAIFNFGPSNENPNVPKGSFKMTGKLNRVNNTIELNGVEWIDQPSNFVMIDIHGTVDLQKNTISGYVSDKGSNNKLGELNIKISHP